MSKLTRAELVNATAFDCGMAVTYGSILEVYSGHLIGEEIDEGDELAVDFIALARTHLEDSPDEVIELDAAERTLHVLEYELAVVVFYDDGEEEKVAVFALDEIED